MTSSSSSCARPPVVAIMGHVDHGKSSLLDYIRKSNIVAGEAGGITQHISAYEVTHTDESGNARRITFIDTPGHAAFTSMRTRGARIADIAILIVSAEDSVKAQTIEAIKTIRENKVPFVVAITKIDKPNANPLQVKTDLMNQEIFVEGMGGSTSVVEISSKTGAGISELLEVILLLADMEDLQGDPTLPARGFIIESHLDEKRGISATAIIKNGTLQKQQFVVSGKSWVGTRMLEDFLGKKIDHATFSSPVILTGFSELPHAGDAFVTYDDKKQAEQAIQEYHDLTELDDSSRLQNFSDDTQSIPLVIKSDTLGTQDALIQEISKISDETTAFKIVKTGIGTINESDIQIALSDPQTIIVGFHVDIDKKLSKMNEYDSLTIRTFSIIYKLIEWLEEVKEDRREKKSVDTTIGQLRILKYFSSTKDKHVVGGHVDMGKLTKGATVKIIRKGVHIGNGTITGIQQAKSEVSNITENNECGIMLQSDHEPIPGDILESFTTEIK